MAAHAEARSSSTKAAASSSSAAQKIISSANRTGVAQATPVLFSLDTTLYPLHS